MLSIIPTALIAFAIGLWIGTIVTHAQCHKKIKTLAEMVESIEKDKVG